MFENNTDFEFDDEIFSGTFESKLSKSESPKRRIENENATIEVKRLCVDSKSPSSHSGSPKQNKTSTFKFLKPTVVNAQSEYKPYFGTKLHTDSPGKMVVLRKFPGPAGLLPERRDLNIDIKALEAVDNKETKQDGTMDMEVVCSQMSVRAFQEGPWEKMSDDFKCRTVFLPDKYNIAWIKSRAKANKLINQKAPFLAAIIQNIECLNLKTAVVSVVLKDATGQIQGTVVHDLYEDYIKYLKVGSVVILKQFSVLTMDHSSNHYITITANNLIKIYSANGADESWTSPKKNNSLPLSQSDNENINVTTIQDISLETLIRNINGVKSRHKAELLEQKLNPDLHLENILLNLRAAQVNTNSHSKMREVRTNIQRTTSQNDIKFMPSTPKSLSMRSLSNNNVNCDKSSLISKDVVINNSAGNSLSVNKENLSAANRFNFKAYINRDKENGVRNDKGINQLQGNIQVSRNSKCDKTELNKSIDVVTSTQISATSNNLEHSEILKNLFEGIDADSLFEDF